MTGYNFISGATGGIGSEFCKVLAARGEKLFVTGRNSQKLCELAKELFALGASDVQFKECDLAQPQSRQSLIDFADEAGIKVSRIIHVAGVDIQKPFSDYSGEKIIFQTRVNNEAVIWLTHALLSRRESGKTQIIVISSMAGVSPMPYFALYSATKSMLTDFFTAIHYELKKDGVSVTTVLPGGVYTRDDIIEQIKDQGVWGKLSAKSPRFVAEKSLAAANKNKIKYIPGFFNRLLHFFMRIVPQRWVLAFIARRWKNIEKDAF